MNYRNGFGNGEEISIRKIFNITGTGAIVANLLQVTGSVRIVDQHAIIKSVNTLVNATNVYATAWDGTNSENLTADGATISGFTPGSLFFKDQDITQPYTVLNASQVRVHELLLDNKAGKPFTIVQKNGVDTFLRFHLTTSDTPIDFDVEVHFLFERISTGANLVFL